MTTQVLVTGGLGYVGGRIAEALVANSGFSVFIGTRRSTSILPPALRGAQTRCVDFTSQKNLEAICADIECIIHLAAANEIESARDPEGALNATTLATLKLLNAAKQTGVRRFIYFSTAHVYGAPLIGTITESTIPKPVHPYAITHKAAEDFVLAAHAQKWLSGLVFRLSNGFGYPLSTEVNRWSLVVNDLCMQAAQTRKLILQTSGEQSRDFIALTDVTRAVLHMLNLPNSGWNDGLFNLGGECAMRIIDMAQLIVDRCEKVLGYVPAIVRPEPGTGAKSESLDYRIDKLKATGFDLRGDMRMEIDRTLLLCARACEPSSKNSING